MYIQRACNKQVVCQQPVYATVIKPYTFTTLMQCCSMTYVPTMSQQQVAFSNSTAMQSINAEERHDVQEGKQIWANHSYHHLNEGLKHAALLNAKRS